MSASEVPIRKRLFAPKRRTGCDVCKKRKLRCDETKPQCIRCQKVGRHCTYKDVPQTWTFEMVPRGASQPGRSPGPPSSLAYALTTTSCTKDEQLALSFFAEKTGPWMAENSGPLRTHPFWKSDLPRLFHYVPATRHLMTAIGLLEASIGLADQQLVNARCLRIHYHYAMGIQSLRSPDLHSVDLALGPLLAWLLETLMLRYHQAEVHANALERLSTNVTLDDVELSRAQFEHAVSNVRRTRSLREHVQLDIPLQQVLAVRSRLYRKTTPEEILQAFEAYYENFDISSMTLAQIRAAELFLDAQAQALHGNVYRSDAPPVTFTALTNLSFISRSLLLVPETKTDEELERLYEGFTYTLNHFEENLTRVLDKKYDQALLYDVVYLALRVLNRFAPAAWRADNALSLSLALTMAAGRATELKKVAVDPGVAQHPIQVMLQKFLEQGPVRIIADREHFQATMKNTREKDLEELYSSSPGTSVSPGGQR
jgi:hypothetical protein